MRALYAEDLDRLHERRRRAMRVVLRTEDGEVLAVGHAPLWTEADRLHRRATTPGYHGARPWLVFSYTPESVVRLGLFTREEIDNYLSEGTS